MNGFSRSAGHESADRRLVSPIDETNAPRAEPIVSIVVPTCNRLHRLQRCIDKIRQNVSTPGEIIVIDGASTDGTRAWLETQPDLHVILESRREGAVRAFNKGFRTARGRYVFWLNDDAFPLHGSVEAAITMIEKPDMADVGMIAFYHNWHSDRNVLDRVEHDGESYELCHVRGYPYANFGLIRRSLLEKIGFADQRYHFFGFDPDLSLKVQLDEGLRVIGCRRALVHHDEFLDDRKRGDLPAGRHDNDKLFAKWNLPPRNGYPDPVPIYRRMLVERGWL
ncbi:MAG: glycosyltransferase family 2 protein [Planctomycetes bacterium]|nr:glycosyltransferase family 2 protein [Planctomycetota bacterium]